MTGGASLERRQPGQRPGRSSAARPRTATPGSTGLVITNGSLTSLDMTVNSTITEAGVTLTADGLHLIYNPTASPSTFSLSGTTTASFPGLGSFSVTLGTAAHPSGLVIQGASLVSLGVTITSALSIDGVTFNANNLAFDYTASSNLYQLTGTTGVTIAGLGGLQVTFGTASNPTAWWSITGRWPRWASSSTATSRSMRSGSPPGPGVRLHRQPADLPDHRHGRRDHRQHGQPQRDVRQPGRRDPERLAREPRRLHHRPILGGQGRVHGDEPGAGLHGQPADLPDHRHGGCQHRRTSATSASRSPTRASSSPTASLESLDASISGGFSVDNVGFTGART